MYDTGMSPLGYVRFSTPFDIALPSYEQFWLNMSVTNERYYAHLCDELLFVVLECDVCVKHANDRRRRLRVR